MKQYQVTIKGVSPLLQHRFGASDAPSKKRTGVPDWQAEVEAALYIDGNGTIYQPAEHIEGALKEAAKNFKVTGRRGASYTRLVGSTVEVDPAAIPHKNPRWVCDSRPVVVQRSRVTRHRPRFDDWELDFTLTLHDDQLQPDVAKQILDYAGLYVGIGDFRPATGGKFGKFMVTRFEEATD